MKKTFLKSLAGIAAVAFAVSCTHRLQSIKRWLSMLLLLWNPSKNVFFPNKIFPLWIMVR